MTASNRSSIYGAGVDADLVELYGIHAYVRTNEKVLVVTGPMNGFIGWTIHDEDPPRQFMTVLPTPPQVTGNAIKALYQVTIAYYEMAKKANPITDVSDSNIVVNAWFQHDGGIVGLQIEELRYGTGVCATIGIEEQTLSEALGNVVNIVWRSHDGSSLHIQL